MRVMQWAAMSLVCGTMAVAQQPKLHVLKVTTVPQMQAFFHYTGKDLPIVSAHRGGSEKGYPENTTYAFQHCLEAAPMMFETDPRLTKDGQLVIMHDPTLERTTMSHGKAKDYTLAELKAIKMKDSFGNEVDAAHPPSLEDAIEWAKGKTILNLDIKDSPSQLRLDAVKKHDAFGWVMFTVHSAKEAKWFYDADKRSMFAAVVFNLDQMKSYEEAGVPWDHIAIAYVGSKDLPENKALYDALHAKGVMVMVAAAPSYDKLPTAEERAAAYRKVFEDGADILETDRAIEAEAAIRSIYPKKSKRYKFWGVK